MFPVTDGTLDRVRSRYDQSVARVLELQAALAAETAPAERRRAQNWLGGAFETSAGAASDLAHVHNTLAAAAADPLQAQICRDQARACEDSMQTAFASAIAAYEQRLQLVREDANPDRQEVESALGDIARTASRAGRLEEAEQALRQLLQLRQHQFGELSEAAAYGHWLLACLYRRFGRESHAQQQESLCDLIRTRYRGPI